MKVCVIFSILSFFSYALGGGVDSIISFSLFNQMLLHRNDPTCPARGFYTYNAFITAANYFGNFGTVGDIDTRKREVAAFLAQTSHETTGGGPGSADGPLTWGYCFVREKDQSNPYCDNKYPCSPGKKYFGRGPMQITHNYNYGQCGQAIHEDLLNHPALVATDPVISFKSALWFWMTPQGLKPSCHDVMTGAWSPSPADQAAGRYPGYGVTTNIINGGVECGQGINPSIQNRVAFYKRYCDMLQIGYGDYLLCAKQAHF